MIGSVARATRKHVGDVNKCACVFEHAQKVAQCESFQGSGDGGGAAVGELLSLFGREAAAEEAELLRCTEHQGLKL